MESVDARATLMTWAERRGESLAALSRLLGRNDAYLQQYVTRGSPRNLHERDRLRLAAYLGIDDRDLGGPDHAGSAPALIRVPRIDVEASAGPGGLSDDDRPGGGEAMDPALLRHLGLRPTNVSIVTARGESMLPTIADGDEMLVDMADTRIAARGAVYVVRLNGMLVVKRLQRRGGAIDVISDNPDFPMIRVTTGIEVIGRVVRLARLLR